MSAVAELMSKLAHSIAPVTHFVRRALTARTSGAVFVLGLLVAFFYGASSDKFKFFPYYELRPLFTFIERGTGAQPEAVRTATGQDYFTSKALSTALLPLTIDTYNLGLKVSMTTEAGGICEVGNKIIVIDRLGKPFAFDMDDKSPAALDWPELPNNFSAFLKSPLAVSKNNFRVHDVLCTKERSGYRIILAHEFFDPDTGKTHLVLSALHIDDQLHPRDASWSRLFMSSPLSGPSYAANGAGGRMALARNGDLILTVGDYNLDGVLNPGKVAQDKTVDQGKVLRINLASGKKERLTLGQRNPQGLVVLGNGEILTTEHGPKGGDELNRIIAGSNYGWPEATYGTDYGSYDWPLSKTQGRQNGFTEPVFAWVPSIGTSELIEVTSFNERWAGDLLVASLKAGTLFRLRYSGGVVRYSEPIWIGPRIRDIIELSNHRIALWTDQKQLVLISVDEKTLSQNKREIAAVMEPGSINCMACHHIGPTNENDAAPSLSAIVGRKVASDNYANYSDALKNLGGVWAEDRLREFLLNPNDYAPGTNMVIGDQTKSQVEKTIKYLKSLD